MRRHSRGRGGRRERPPGDAGEPGRSCRCYRPAPRRSSPAEAPGERRPGDLRGAVLARRLHRGPAEDLCRAGGDSMNGWDGPDRLDPLQRAREAIALLLRGTGGIVMELGTWRLKTGLAEMLKGGVIMDVTNADQAKIAEDAGAVSVMALERVPADIRAQGGVARMASVKKIKEIMDVVTIPVMAKCRIGHFVEAQILQAIGVDYIDESEVLTPADEHHHVDKFAFTVPFVCGARDLGEALRRIGEGAALIRTKGEAGSGNILEAVRHIRAITGGIRRLTTLESEELMTEAKNLGAPYDLVKWVAENGRLPVVLFTAGGIATPADAAMMMQLGADGVFVGSGIFKSDEPTRRSQAIVKATTRFRDAKAVAEASKGLGEAMVGKEMGDLAEGEKLATRGW